MKESLIQQSLDKLASKWESDVLVYGLLAEIHLNLTTVLTFKNIIPDLTPEEVDILQAADAIIKRKQEKTMEKLRKE